MSELRRRTIRIRSRIRTDTAIRCRDRTSGIYFQHAGRAV